MSADRWVIECGERAIDPLVETIYLAMLATGREVSNDTYVEARVIAVEVNRRAYFHGWFFPRSDGADEFGFASSRPFVDGERPAWSFAEPSEKGTS